MTSNAASTENKSAEDQKATDQLANMKPEEEQPKLTLSGSTRTHLISNFTQLSDILQADEPMPRDAQQRTCQTIADSVSLLVSPFRPTACDEDASFEKKASSKIAVQLSRAEQARIIRHLMANQDAVLDDQTTAETKRNLIAENDAIVLQLLKLPRRKQPLENSVESASKKQKVESGSCFTEELDHLRKELNRGKGELVGSLEAMKSELEQAIKNVDITRREVSFQFEMLDVPKFFEANWNERHSGRFWCQSLQWSIKVKLIQSDDSTKVTQGDNQTKHLGVYLFCHNDDQLKWSCKVNCKLILFSQLSPEKNRVRDLVHTYDKKKGFGYRCFISYSELTDQANGYIQDGKAVVGVELKTEPVFTESKSEDPKATA